MAFAGNSILCRLALGNDVIDAASFTSIRLLSGIVTLLVILQLSQRQNGTSSRGSWYASFMLFLYAIAFAFAYISLTTGVGALILFGSVQFTMIIAGIISGDRPHYSEWIGVVLAFFGFTYLLMPTLDTPSLNGTILMVISGIAWATYTLLGRHSKNPLADTTYNFLRTLPLVIILLLVSFQYTELSQRGILLAFLSGSITSGIGYTVWYMALRGLSAIQAAVIQLLVPVIAAIGGILFINEAFSMRLLVSSLMILGGILIVILTKSYLVQDKQ